MVYLFQLKFEDRYKKLQQHQAGLPGTSTSILSCSTVRQTTGLLWQNIVDSDSDEDNDLLLTNNSELWMVEFDSYIRTVEAVSSSKDTDDLDIVEWWGVSYIIL